MESVVIYNGHRIAIEHHLDSIKLVVDDVKYDEVNGLRNTNRDNVLAAKVVNAEGGTDDITVEYEDAKLVKLTGKLKYYYNGKLIAEKKTM